MTLEVCICFWYLHNLNMTLLHTTKKGSIKTPQILEKKNGILKKSLLFCYVDNSCHPEGLARQHMND